jgi:tol-pal system protein YbgF
MTSGSGFARALLVGTLFSGCAHANMRAQTGEHKQANDQHVAELRAQLVDRDERLNKLENRLSLIEAEQRQHRMALESLENPVGIRETVRIGAQAEAPRAAEEPTAFQPELEPARRREPRPVLKLYEQAAAPPSEGAMMPVPEVSERLPPFIPMPPGALAAPAPAAPGDPDGDYRKGIDLLRQREFDAALISFNDFLVRYPGDPRAPRVLFWRGEVLFAQRDYPRALSAFETVLTKEPRGEKAADAWLKVALCHKRLGAPDRARAALERLKTQFPNSDAARLAAQEDA